MIPQQEILKLSAKWGVPPDTVEKDHVLGHFLSVFCKYYDQQLIFKGGTCLRKCYYPDYRFSEDMDFSSARNDFELENRVLKTICEEAQAWSGILFSPETTKALTHKNIKKGFQVKIRYWGANHSRNQMPPSPERWMTKIKLEITTEELLLFPQTAKMLLHPFSDTLYFPGPVVCYATEEMIAEKLRSLVQRSYTAPRDFYDLYHLTKEFKKQDWNDIRPVMIRKMAHKGITYTGAEQLTGNSDLAAVKKAWAASLAHQTSEVGADSATKMIHKVVQDIKENL